MKLFIHILIIILPLAVTIYRNQSSSVPMKLLVKGIGQLVTVTEGQRFLAGPDMANIKLREGSLAVAVDNEGRIAMIGSEAEVVNTFSEETFSSVIDAEGGAVLPGLVDGHTHPVWAGDRVHEFAMKLAGASYMEVHAAGGGIHFTVEKTRAASEAELVELLVPRLRRMLRAGTTTVECKVNTDCLATSGSHEIKTVCSFLSSAISFNSIKLFVMHSYFIRSDKA